MVDYSGSSTHLLMMEVFKVRQGPCLMVDVPFFCFKYKIHDCDVIANNLWLAQTKGGGNMATGITMKKI